MARRSSDEPRQERKVGREPLRTYRCPDDLYARVKAHADEQGRSIADVIREGFEAYVARRDRVKERAAQKAPRQTGRLGR